MGQILSQYFLTLFWVLSPTLGSSKRIKLYYIHIKCLIHLISVFFSINYCGENAFSKNNCRLYYFKWYKIHKFIFSSGHCYNYKPQSLWSDNTRNMAILQVCWDNASLCLVSQHPLTFSSIPVWVTNDIVIQDKKIYWDIR